LPAGGVAAATTRLEVVRNYSIPPGLVASVRPSCRLIVPLPASVTRLAEETVKLGKKGGSAVCSCQSEGGEAPVGRATVIETIVTFTNPPVVEVVAGVAFDGVDPLLGPMLAAFWKEQLRDRFPVVQHQPPYTPPVEQFPTGGAVPGLSFEFGLALPASRLWVQSRDGQELLQLQPGYFACNWRKVQPSGEYDRWLKRRSAFKRWFEMLSDYLVAEGNGQPKVTQCEVTYVNHIRPGASWSRHSEFNKVFAVTASTPADYPPEQISTELQLALVDGDQAYGRLHIKILPAFDRDGKTPLYVLELTARGAPSDDGVGGATAFLDRGREAIDRTFVAITTGAMHLDWGMVP